ncbi:hypothetical protein OQJ22_09680 [Legionella pneumophila]|uniref:hypothetical protein n=1 Tax=Legionella TaxID=445 RepID=UPI0022447E36|nr:MULTISPECIES: hypothetical protein [Legionella]MCW8398107.1 hypothetical protein [Legionella sp. PATHC038]MCW8431943.1 hypothetical protein [Legionella pneumophila]HCE5342851.1 hypothetical protein [Legionella pneumophila]HCE5352063.1 hypothetical protein [Legionella pneumophila]HCE5361186.1 hypothetical protein [Legionella pneumophila]
MWLLLQLLLPLQLFVPLQLLVPLHLLVPLQLLWLVLHLFVPLQLLVPLHLLVPLQLLCPLQLFFSDFIIVVLLPELVSWLAAAFTPEVNKAAAAAAIIKLRLSILSSLLIILSSLKVAD